MLSRICQVFNDKTKPSPGGDEDDLRKSYVRKLNRVIYNTLVATLALGLASSTVFSVAGAQADEVAPISVEQHTGSTESIIGADDRVKVADTTVSPFSSVVRTEVQVSAYGLSLGSGTVIGKNLILTAGHVSAKFKNMGDWNYVFPGRQGDYQPYGKFKIKEAYTMPYTDLGVFVVHPNAKGQSIGDLVPIMPIKQAGAVGDTVMLPGYGGDKGGEQWVSYGTIIGEIAKAWDYTADTKGGNSGGPVYNLNNEIIGVHINGGTTSNGGTKLHGEMYGFVKKHIDADAQAAKPPVATVAAPTLSGVSNVEINLGDSFNKLAGVKATDKIDGDLTSKIQVTGSVDTQKAGSYTLSYSVTNSKGKTATAKRTVTVKAKPAPTPTPSNDTWKADKIYVAGDTVTYKGKPYKAKWWTKNNAPDTSSAWEQIVPKSSDGSVAYMPGKSYTAATIVKYNGKNYKAKWWTTSVPGSDSSWTTP